MSRLPPRRLGDALAACLAGLPRPASGLALAFSGGLDSSVLLDLLATLPGPRLPLRVLHVDHRLQAESAAWSRHCAEFAAAHGLEFRALVVAAGARPGQSPEAAARAARYAALAAELRSEEVLLTAHHADDQLETVLLQMLRGGGARAATGMPRLARLAGGWHARPLLGFRRAELDAHARAAGLRWIEDPSNAELRFDRNYLRAKVLPPLLERWPAAAEAVGRVARLSADTVRLADERVAEDLQRLVRGRALRFADWQRLPAYRRHAVLRSWLLTLGLPVPTERQLLALERDFDAAAADRVPCRAWPGARVWRYRGHLHAASAQPEAGAAAARGLAWDGANALDWPAGGRLELQTAPGPGLALQCGTHGFRVATRRGGERFAPRAGGRRALQKWLQERGVLPWWRDALPLLWLGEELVAVADLGCAAQWAAASGTGASRLLWRDAPVVTEEAAFGYTALPS